MPGWIRCDQERAFRILAGTVALLALFQSPVRAAENCTLLREASLDAVRDSLGRFAVPVSIEGHPLTMVVDTGGVLTMLGEASADALSLAKHSVMDSHVRMFGGQILRRYVDVRDFAIGGAKVDNAQFLLLPTAHLPPGIDGILGPDLLFNFDVDFDFANAKLNLFSPKHCAGDVVYWTQSPAIAELPIHLDEVHHIVIDVVLDGKRIEAVVDTGSPITILSLERAEDLFDIAEDTSGMKPALSAVEPGSYRYPFRTLDLNGVVVDNPDVLLVPDADSHFAIGGPKMLIGMSILHHLHLYVAYRERTLYASAADAK